MSHHRESDDDDSINREHSVKPHNRKQRGWAGDHLEREHERTSTLVDGESSAAVAVDLNQFRNTEVGKGYQAKHVIRQRTAETSSTSVPPVILNMTTRRNANEDVVKSSTTAAIHNDDSRRKRKSRSTDHSEEDQNGREHRRKESSRKASDRTRRGRDDSLEKYLRCEAFRAFRRELEKMRE